MAYRKLSASYIFSAHSGFLKNSILILDSCNRVLDLIDTGGDLQEVADLEYYNGILTPGFVSIYRHLEPSHLYGQIPCGTVRPGFYKQLKPVKDVDQAEIMGFISLAYDEISMKGSLATADITNSNDKVSILAEMIVFQKHNPETGLKYLLTWATINGAKAMGIEEQSGSFEKGKQPGVNLIEHVDLQRMILKERSRIKIIVA